MKQQKVWTYENNSPITHSTYSEVVHTVGFLHTKYFTAILFLTHETKNKKHDDHELLL